MVTNISLVDISLIRFYYVRAATPNHSAPNGEFKLPFGARDGVVDDYNIWLVSWSIGSMSSYDI